MVELWFYSGRLGNCMFMHAFTKIISDTLQIKANLPKGTEIQGFPLIRQESISVKQHDHKYTCGEDFVENPKTLRQENDNMEWYIEKNFQGKKMEGYEDFIKISDIISKPDIDKKWLVLLGNFELGENYTPYRNKLKKWFKYPELDLSKFEFFKLHPLLDKGDYFIGYDYKGITSNDLVISLRLEDYTTKNNFDRFLGYDYFKIILNNIRYDKLYIITNPGSIGHNDQYKYLKEFLPHDPIIVRVYEPVQSMAFGSQFNNIAISQSTYSWWLAFLSNAENIYYPIAKEGPFALNDDNHRGCDLRVMSKDFKYVDYKQRRILPKNYYKLIDYKNSSWISQEISTTPIEQTTDSPLEAHTLIHRKDIELYLKTYILFRHYYKKEFTPVLHEDGSFTEEDINYLKSKISNVEIVRRHEADTKMKEKLKDYPLCSHFRFAEHHTIFRIKLFDPFLLSNSNNVLYLDSDILFSKEPQALINCIDRKVGAYLRDSWSAYCVPFRDEDNDTVIDRYINAGLTYFPTKNHYSLDYIEQCLEILYQNGSRGATHPFLEQTCIAYLISKQKDMFEQLPHPDYCVPTFGKFIPDHNLIALHINSSPIVGKYREEHYEYELNKIKQEKD